jgi:hypothetical protein
MGFLSFGVVSAAIATNANHKIATRVGNVYSFNEDYLMNFLLQNTKPGEPVFIYPYCPMYYFLANVKNQTRYSILVYQINTEAQFDEAISDLEKNQTKYVLWDTYASANNLTTWFPQYCQPPEDRQILEKYLRGHYEVIAEKNKFKILQRREN